jgi:hypothetical protein
MGNNKLKEFEDAVKAAGGTVEVTKGNHLKVTGPEGFAIIGKPGRDPQPRTLKNEMSRVRRHTGLNIQINYG